jgi:hypothetical protein
MGVEYNHLGEECKSSKQEREKICMGREKNYSFTFLHESSFNMHIFGQNESGEC